MLIDRMNHLHVRILNIAPGVGLKAALRSSLEPTQLHLGHCVTSLGSNEPHQLDSDSPQLAHAHASHQHL